MTSTLLRLAIVLLVVRPAVWAAETPLSPDDFFDGSSLHEIRITIRPADWQLLKDNYLANTYYRCEFEWRGIRVSNVGVRSRGSGTRNPIKPSLAFDFTRYDPAQRFLGMKAVNTRNFAQDASMLRERLTIAMFRKLGLPYLREAHARLFVNGEYAGVYLILEPIDGRFLQTRLGEENGYLYEFKWTGTP